MSHSKNKLVRSLNIFLMKINHLQFGIFAREMSTVNLCSKENILKKIFSSGVDAVQPKAIFHRNNFEIISRNGKEIVRCCFGDNRRQNDVYIDITGKRCQLIGFGKAVLGMGFEINNVLGDRLKSGLLSVPFGTVDKFQEIKMPTKLKVYEGARNNLPDADAMETAKKCLDFMKCLNKNDILFILISGGGSALLPMPSEGVNLEEKYAIIKQLTRRGASISDLNRVRIDLSETKGGKLATYANNVHKVITFIISDIIGDPIHLIASGPTHPPIEMDNNNISSIAILQKYDLWSSLPQHIQNVMLKNSQREIEMPNNILNLIIGNNESAIQAASAESSKNNLIPFVLSTHIDGSVKELSEAYSNLAKYIRHYQNAKSTDKEFQENLLTLKSVLKIRDEFFEAIVAFLRKNKQSDFCVIAGGEPTVEITGTGIGGRNQELALRFSLHCIHDELLQSVLLLSAGTDGIDGKDDGV